MLLEARKLKTMTATSAQLLVGLCACALSHMIEKQKRKPACLSRRHACERELIREAIYFVNQLS
jgi:hypothetical protein